MPTTTIRFRNGATVAGSLDPLDVSVLCERADERDTTICTFGDGPHAVRPAPADIASIENAWTADEVPRWGPTRIDGLLIGWHVTATLFGSRHTGIVDGVDMGHDRMALWFNDGTSVTWKPGNDIAVTSVRSW